MKSIETEVVALVERNGRLILQSVGMEQEKGYIQHGAVSCYLHSFFVAYMSVWLAKRFRIRIHLRSLVRGALLHLRVDARDRGIIPACAGSTHHESDGADDERDHPRMCGEHLCKTFCKA